MIKIGRDSQVVLHKSAFTNALGVSVNAFDVAIFKAKNGKSNVFSHYEDEEGVWVFYSGLSEGYKARVRGVLCGGLEPEAWLAERIALEKRAFAEKMRALADEGYTRYMHLFTQGNRQKSAQKYALAKYLTEEFLPSQKLSLSNLKFIKEQIAPVYAHLGQKPSDARKLQMFLKTFAQADKEEQVALCTNQLVHHKNASKFENETLRAQVIALRGHGANFSIAHIYKVVREICQKENQPVPSQSWVAKICTEQVVTNITQAQRGARREAPLIYTPIAKPDKAGVCWQVDGTRLNFVAHKDQDGKDKFLYIIAVMDMFSGCYVGTYLGHTENRYAVIGALQNACENTGYLPENIVIDRFPGHNTQEFRTLAEKLTLRYGVQIKVTSEATGKAQVERSFRTFQETVLQGSALYYGEGITSSRNFAHRSEDYLKKIKKANIGLETAIDEAVRMIDAYNYTPLCLLGKSKETKSRQILHDEQVSVNVTRLAQQDVAYLFYTQTHSKVSGGNIKITYQSQANFYPLPENMVMEYNNVQLDVYYNEGDLSVAYAFKGERYLTALSSVKPIDVFNEPERIKEATERKKRVLAMQRNELKAMEEKAGAKEVFNTDYLAMLTPKSTPKSIKHKAEERFLNKDISTDEGMYRDAQWKI